MRRYLLVQLYLAWHTVVAVMFASALVLTPQRLLAGASTATLYHALEPPVWGVMFLALAAVCGVGARWPLQCWRLAVLGLGVAQIAWAIGLMLPLFLNHRGNVLAPLAWLALAITTGIVALETIREERVGSNGRG